jgi:hypothetical protein
MTRFETIIQAVRSGTAYLAMSLAAMPVDKPSIASLIEPALHGLASVPWPVAYLGSAIVAKYAHHRMWIVYGAMAIKLWAGGH